MSGDGVSIFKIFLIISKFGVKIVTLVLAGIKLFRVS